MKLCNVDIYSPFFNKKEFVSIEGRVRSNALNKLRQLVESKLSFTLTATHLTPTLQQIQHILTLSQAMSSKLLA